MTDEPAEPSPLHIEPTVWFDHQTLLRDVNTLLAVYDQFAQGVLQLAFSEGYFEGVDPALLKWPPSMTDEGMIGLEGLGYRVKLISAIYEGVPKLRDQRLEEAGRQLAAVTTAYHESTRMYAQTRHQFLSTGAGTEQDFLELYQTIYIEALRAKNLFTPDGGEAALAGARLSRVPLAFARPVAVKLKTTIADDDPRWDAQYVFVTEERTVEATLRDICHDIARRTLDCMAAGELLAVRYNTYTNFAWFGSAIWKILNEAEFLLEVCRRTLPAGVIHHQLDGLKDDILLGQSMMVEFFQAHQENPANLKPTGYWYGHHYTGLTRDMIDLSNRIMTSGNRLIQELKQQTGASANPQVLAMLNETKPMTPPALLLRSASGRFLEYPHVGRNGRYTGLQRAVRLGRWIFASWNWMRHKTAIEEQGLPENERLEAAWRNSLHWADQTLRIFGIDVRVKIDPLFKTIARDLDLASGKYKILFFPTHQSVFDHPVMYRVLESPELLDAIGWTDSRPCTILSRSGLTEYVTIRLGAWRTTLFGVNETEFDRLLEEVDGYVVLPRTGDTNNATQRFAGLLEQRPGIIYPAGTTAAFDIQSIPLQHGLFSKIPSDVILIPMAFRGIHSIWPKCPRRNIRINPGIVEVAVAPPMAGETTLFPKRRTLRPQLEPATLFQATQIVNLLNPEYKP
ncbi:MAG: hypothetical protein FJY97_17655 [candidate division Zixibacteria bacterium]|nr:hypothetical protein [candidate division Zixibacteria bacterium]